MHGRSDGLIDDLWGRDRKTLLECGSTCNVRRTFLRPGALLARTTGPVSFTFPMHGAGEWSCV